MDAGLKTISIGMLGAGVVGSQVARLLQSDRQELSDRSGALLVLKKVGVRTNTAREGIDASLITTDLHSIVTDPEINIVVEVLGGIEPARTLILEAIKNKKSVITANKALLATHGHELFNAADAAKVDLYYEAAGELMFYGRGAGGAPTASAILGDLVAVTRHRAYSTVGYGESDYADLDIAPMGEVKSQFFVRLHVADKSGVLASIAQTFASEDISIQTVRQTGLGKDAELVVVTHAASESSLTACIEKLTAMEIVSKVESVIRVEGAVS